jgi:hypothetical protein
MTIKYYWFKQKIIKILEHVISTYIDVDTKNIKNYKNYACLLTQTDFSLNIEELNRYLVQFTNNNKIDNKIFSLVLIYYNFSELSDNVYLKTIINQIINTIKMICQTKMVTELIINYLLNLFDSYAKYNNVNDNIINKLIYTTSLKKIELLSDEFYCLQQSYNILIDFKFDNKSKQSIEYIINKQSMIIDAINNIDIDNGIINFLSIINKNIIIDNINDQIRNKLPINCYCKKSSNNELENKNRAIII